MNGLGDLVEALIPNILKPKECSKCAERKERLNKAVPFIKKETRILKRSRNAKREK